MRRGSTQAEAAGIAAVDAASHCGREPRPVAVAPSLEARKFAPSPGHPTAIACLRSRLRLASEHRAGRNPAPVIIGLYAHGGLRPPCSKLTRSHKAQLLPRREEGQRRGHRVIPIAKRIGTGSGGEEGEKSRALSVAEAAIPRPASQAQERISRPKTRIAAGVDCFRHRSGVFAVAARRGVRRRLKRKLRERRYDQIRQDPSQEAPQRPRGDSSGLAQSRQQFLTPLVRRSARASSPGYAAYQERISAQPYRCPGTTRRRNVCSDELVAHSRAHPGGA